jgi:hypothetical protein
MMVASPKVLQYSSSSSSNTARNHHDPTSANCYLLLLVQCSLMLRHTLQAL